MRTIEQILKELLEHPEVAELDCTLALIIDDEPCCTIMLDLADETEDENIFKKGDLRLEVCGGELTYMFFKDAVEKAREMSRPDYSS